MSLVERMMEPCVIVNKVQVSDGEGGLITKWEDGPEFMAAITYDTTMQARIAEQEGTTNTFTITTGRNVLLDFHDVVKRLSDGQTFRVRSYSADKKTPAFVKLDIAQVTAEKWEVTT